MQFAPRWWWAALTVVIAAAIHAFTAWEKKGPIFAADEVGTVGASQVIAHGGTDWILAGSGYMPGTALLLSPAWWFTDDPFTVYRVGLCLGVALTLLTAIPLAQIARHVGIRSVAGSYVVAGVILLAPARTVPSNYVISEQLLTLVTACIVAWAFRVRRSPSLVTHGVLGALAALAFLAHGRGIALTAAVCAWVLIASWRNWSGVLISWGSAAVVAALSWLLYRWVASELYWNDDRVNQTFNGLLDHTPMELLGTVFGQAWYVLAAWPAVGIIGMAIAVRRWRLKSADLLLGIALLTTLALALVQLDKTNESVGLIRLDAWIYGRYLDHLYTVAAVIGLAIVVRVRSRLILAFVAGAGAVIAAGFLLITAPQIVPGSAWSHVHVAGVVHMLSLENYATSTAEPWLMLTLAAWGISALIAAAARVRTTVQLLGVLWLALSVATDANVVDLHDEPKRLTTHAADEVAPVLPAGEPVAFNIEYGLGINTFAFAFHPREVVPVTVEEAAAGYSGIYTVYGDVTPYDKGALPFYDGSLYNFWFWVFPGQAFDDLDAEGRLTRPEIDNS